MDSSTKKVFNTISYVLNFIFIINSIIFLIVYFTVRRERLEDSGDNNEANIKENIEYVKHSVIERESAEIPLWVQKFDNVHKIRIDSLVLTQSKTQPYSGYLVTVWDINSGYKDNYKRKEKVVYVEIVDIYSTKKKVSWYSRWESAHSDATEY